MVHHLFQSHYWAEFILNMIMTAEKVGGWTSWITKYICFVFFLIYYLVTLLPWRMWLFCFCILLCILIALLHPLVLFSFSCMYLLPSLFSIIFILAEKYFKSCKFTCVMFLKIKKKIFQIQIKILFIVKNFLYSLIVQISIST